MISSFYSTLILCLARPDRQAGVVFSICLMIKLLNLNRFKEHLQEIMLHNFATTSCWISNKTLALSGLSLCFECFKTELYSCHWCVCVCVCEGVCVCVCVWRTIVSCYQLPSLETCPPSPPSALALSWDCCRAIWWAVCATLTTAWSAILTTGQRPLSADLAFSTLYTGHKH